METLGAAALKRKALPQAQGRDVSGVVRRHGGGRLPARDSRAARLRPRRADDPKAAVRDRQARRPAHRLAGRYPRAGPCAAVPHGGGVHRLEPARAFDLPEQGERAAVRRSPAPCRGHDAAHRARRVEIRDPQSEAVRRAARSRRAARPRHRRAAAHDRLPAQLPPGQRVHGPAQHGRDRSSDGGARVDDRRKGEHAGPDRRSPHAPVRPQRRPAGRRARAHDHRGRRGQDRAGHGASDGAVLEQHQRWAG